MPRALAFSNSAGRSSPSPTKTSLAPGRASFSRHSASRRQQLRINQNQIANTRVEHGADVPLDHPIHRQPRRYQRPSLVRRKETAKVEVPYGHALEKPVHPNSLRKSVNAGADHGEPRTERSE